MPDAGSGPRGGAGSTPVPGLAGHAGSEGDPTGGETAQGGSAGAAPAGGGGGEGGLEGSAGSPPLEPTCQNMSDCPTGENCVQHACVPALVSCAAHKNSHGSSTDGVYWIAPSGTPQRAYCDMSLSTELCTEVASEHQGRTRDAAAVGYTMSSVLLLNQGVCKLWAIRGSDDGHPFQSLKAVEGVPEAHTCVALGFKGDGELGECPYGTSLADCGFAARPMHLYGNYCTGCALNDGAFDRWTLQGPIITGNVLSSVSGTTFTTCKTR